MSGAAVTLPTRKNHTAGSGEWHWLHSQAKVDSEPTGGCRVTFQLEYDNIIFRQKESVLLLQKTWAWTDVFETFSMDACFPFNISLTACVRLMYAFIQVPFKSWWGNPRGVATGFQIPPGPHAKPNTTLLLFLRHGGWLRADTTRVCGERRFLSFFIAARDFILNLPVPTCLSIQMRGGQGGVIPEAALPHQSSDLEGEGGERKRGEQDQRRRNLFKWAGRGGAQLGLPCCDSLSQGPCPNRTANQGVCESESQLQCWICYHKVNTRWFLYNPAFVFFLHPSLDRS